MKSINPDAFEYLLSQIKDGNIFERFAQDLLCEIIGVEFIPIGGIHDCGIDGLDHSFSSKDSPSTIYQISIQSTSHTKIKTTVETLLKNKINCERLFYVTNRIVEDQSKIIEELYKNHKIHLTFYDSKWLRGNINKTNGTIRIYGNFIEKHTHEFNRPEKNLLVTDFIKDPRVFVFLRQQLDIYGSDHKLDELLVDSLILYALEGTDPEKNIFKNKQEILDSIKKLTAFDTKRINQLIDKRIEHLTRNPKKIRYHRQIDGYCLPFETRIELEEQKLSDQSIFDSFYDNAGNRLNKHLEKETLTLSNASHIVSMVVNEIFKRQGLDFSNFVLKGDATSTLENELNSIIATTLTNVGTPASNQTIIGNAVLSTIRDILYRGTPEELEYFRRLSKSYLMLFLLKCDPHVCSYFDELASNLTIFVCNSLIVPALSEIGLPAQNRRHWNLLKSATQANISLVINSVTIKELVGHISMIRKIYDEKYKGLEHQYETEITLKYVKEMLIRAYLYGRANGSKDTFDDYINKFVTPTHAQGLMCQELQIFLNEEFGIKFIEHDNFGIKLNETEVKGLVAVLELHKRTSHQAANDANTILSIYEIRKKNNEQGTAGAFGFKTWWLSKDTTTHLAVKEFFKKESRVSCYLRPDFLLNYITLSINTRTANKLFDKMFPTLIGVSISHHVTDDVCDAVNAAIKTHKDLAPSRVKAVVGSMSTKMMAQGIAQKSKSIVHYIDEQLKAST